MGTVAAGEPLVADGEGAATSEAKVALIEAAAVTATAKAIFFTSMVDSDQLAPAPSPTIEAGAGFAVTVSGAFLGSTLFCSLAALLLH
ncbi:hypothetical protein FNV43_RR02993 [Rhamnella rubrinervis]|uniref:Uncharacterized protein n=1 Tax=Rhamnella rubrinervis TaxID=2594499 RepID=A0A8K0HHM4_9ROSA|nr:hypothetical protein FNV43_RR02993 [Rhamnella rubrinervis]